MQTLLRNQNAGRELMDYDLNIYIPEELDEQGRSYWDPASWHIHVYAVDGAGHYEADKSRPLSQQEIISLGLNHDEYFNDVDTWYGYDGFMKDYWSKMPDSLKLYLELFPKYKGDYNYKQDLPS